MGRKSKAQESKEAFDKQLRDAKNLEKISKSFAIALKNIQRGASGLPPDEDIFSGLLNRTDIRERSRITLRETYRHSCMRMLATLNGGFEIWDDIANMEDTYSIAKDGEQWVYAIEMLKTRAQGPGTVINTGPQALPGAPQPHKRSFVEKLTGRNKEATNNVVQTQ